MKVHEHLVFSDDQRPSKQKPTSERRSGREVCIAEYGRRRVDELSKGNQQKVQIIGTYARAGDCLPRRAFHWIGSGELRDPELELLGERPDYVELKIPPEWTPT